MYVHVYCIIWAASIQAHYRGFALCLLYLYCYQHIFTRGLSLDMAMFCSFWPQMTLKWWIAKIMHFVGVTDALAKPQFGDLTRIVHSISKYYTIIWANAQLDQMVEGITVLGIHDVIKSKSISIWAAHDGTWCWGECRLHPQFICYWFFCSWVKQMRSRRTSHHLLSELHTTYRVVIQIPWHKNEGLWITHTRPAHEMFGTWSDPSLIAFMWVWIPLESCATYKYIHFLQLQMEGYSSKEMKYWLGFQAFLSFVTGATRPPPHNRCVLGS